MSSGKKVVSVRLKDEQHCEQNRISLQQWQEFRQISDYFNESDNFIVETALRYLQCEKNKMYQFDSSKFDKICSDKKGLLVFRDSLVSGQLEKTMEVNFDNGKILIPKGIDMLYFPPCIITFEPSFQTRVTLDLTKCFHIRECKEKIYIDCNQKRKDDLL